MLHAALWIVWNRGCIVNVMKYFLICHLHANLLLVAVVTSRSWWVLAADAGLRLSFPGHVSFLLVPAGSGAAAGPEQPSSGFPSEDLTQPAFDLLLHHDWFIVRWPLAVSHCTCKYVNTLNKIQGYCPAVQRSCLPYKPPPNGKCLECFTWIFLLLLFHFIASIATSSEFVDPQRNWASPVWLSAAFLCFFCHRKLIFRQYSPTDDSWPTFYFKHQSIKDHFKAFLSLPGLEV